jgi:threonylcarbamoyladenosine tRNA methylthiotransferase MtaB
VTEILSFGCRLNALEGEAIRAHLAGAPETPNPDIIVVNTCAVTAEAERQARQAIRRAARQRPGVPIVVTGCAAQIAPASWSTLPGVTRVLGNTEKLTPEAWRGTAPVQVADIMTAPRVPASPVTEFAGRTRAFLQIQQGCDHRCTFCTIPLGRGNSRSVEPDAIIAQASALIAAGHQEIILTGVDLTSYGADLPPTPGMGRPRLGTIATRLLAETALPRLRLSSIDPAELDDDLWSLLETNPRLMPSLHLSLQSGSDLLLKRMKRRHSASQAEAVIARARALRPGIAIGADLIAGFPTETEELFQETLAFVTSNAIPYLHVFPYSERPNTPAARMPAVPVPVRRDRARLLREAAAANAAAWHATFIGRTVTVLAEGDGTGRSEHGIRVRLSAEPGTLTGIRITSADAEGLIA